MATSLSQFGITITFSANVTTGQFANGDFWFLPTSIISISPASGPALGWEVAHGAEINPFPRYCHVGDNGVKQGLAKHDSVTWPGIPVSSETLIYDPALNVANGVSVGSPLVMTAGMSLICSISKKAHDEPGTDTHLGDSAFDTLAVFTCVASPPIAGTFRPSYCGTATHKDLSVNVSQINWDNLGPGWTLTTPNPGLTFIQRHVERTWTDWIEGWRGKAIRGVNNVSRWNPASSSLGDAGYARGLCNEWGDCMLQILDNSLSIVQKTPLMIRMIQVGLDHYGMMRHVQSTTTGVGPNHLDDSSQNWVTNEWVGATVYTGIDYATANPGAFMVVTSNTATRLTGSAGWFSTVSGASIGGAPLSGGTYRLGCNYGFHNSDGGHGQGGKAIMLFAGIMLDRQDIKDLCTTGDKYWRNAPFPNGIHFQEDGQYFYVEETRTGIYNWQSPFCDGGRATGVTSTTLVDNWKNLGSANNWSTNEWVGAVVEMGGKTATVTSNTKTQLSFSAGWSGGGQPALGAYRVGKNFGTHTYIAADDGMPEWCYAHADVSTPRNVFFGVSGPIFHDGKTRTNADGASRLLTGADQGENHDFYRTCCTINAWCGIILAYMKIPGARALWNHEAFFDYADRYWDGFGSYHPSSGGAIIDVADINGTDEAWYGRGGRPNESSPGGVDYDYWQLAMWNAKRSTVEEPAYALEGFRFRKDDGSEALATWEANQDVSITVGKEARRLRTLTDTSGAPGSPNPDTAGAKLQVRRVGTTTWTDITT